jgi:hypothetical protein
MAHIVALATATEAKRPMTDGNPVVYMFDVYASLLWCCRKIKERTYLETKSFTADDVFELLRLEWRQDQPYLRDETASILWATFVNDANSANGRITQGVKDMNHNVQMPGNGKSSSFEARGATTPIVQAAQEARIEAFFAEFFSYSVGLKASWKDGPDWGTDPCKFTFPMGLYVFPLTPGQVNANLKTPMATAAWDSSLDDFMQTAKDDLDKFMATGGACKPGEYFSKKRKTCLPIPSCPQPGDDAKKTKFDENTETCVEPSSGGGGGGGSGSPLLLLLLLLLALAYVSSR